MKLTRTQARSALLILALMSVIPAVQAQVSSLPSQTPIILTAYDDSTGYFEASAVSPGGMLYDFGGSLSLEPTGETEQAQVLWIGDGEGNFTPVDNTAQITWSDGPVAQITWSD